MIIGFAIALIGELIRLLSVSYAGSETRTTTGVGGSNLVTQGPYSIIRNPLYAGNILIYTGLGIMSFSLFPYLQIAGLLYFVIQYYAIILNEEEHLREKFSDKYPVYELHVHRFLPIPKKLPAEIKSNLVFDIKSGLRSESRSIQAFLITFLVILFFYVTGFRIL